MSRLQFRRVYICYFENWFFPSGNGLYCVINKIMFGYILLVSVSPVCTEDEFECGQGQCVPKSKRCDLKRDCANGQDEIDCGKTFHYLPTITTFSVLLLHDMSWLK